MLGITRKGVEMKRKDPCAVINQFIACLLAVAYSSGY